MNERIKQLALQAGFETNEANLSFGNYVQYNEYFYADDFIEDELKKFAELIVRECCDIFVELRTRPADLAVKDVKKHFGVEE